MKKIFLTIYLILNFMFGHSQIIKSIGIKSGMTYTTQDWVYQSINVQRDIKYKTGFYEAMTLELFNNKYLSLVTDLSYAQKGYKETATFRNINNPAVIIGYLNYDTRFDFLSLSPMLKARTNIRSFSPYVMIGPRIDYCISYKSINDFSSIVSGSNKPVYGLSSVVGVEFKKNKIGILAEGHYLLDFSHFYDTKPTGGITHITIDNKAYILTLGFKYYFNK